MCFLKISFMLSVLLLTCSVSALNILGIFPYHGKSHFFVFKVYLKELATRGHNVTVISHFPQKDIEKNYQDISLWGSGAEAEDFLPIKRNYLTILKTGIYLTFSGAQNCEQMLANKEVQSLIKRKPKFDVVVFEYFNSDCALGIAHYLKAPVVGLTTNFLLPWHYERLGLSSNPAGVPSRFLEGGSTPTLYQRVERVIFDFYFKTLYKFQTQRNEQKTLSKYFDDIPPLEDLARKIKFLLVYHNFVLTKARIFPSNVIEVGGYHIAAAKPLTGDILKFVEGAKNGVIFISFGSVAKVSTLSADKLQAISEAINKLPYRFIWKIKSGNKTVQNVKAHKLYISDWLPQIDILAHQKTLAFLSHSGMLGTTEAIHYGVPMVAMPIFGDQPANAASVEESGLGVQIQIRDLTRENLVRAFKKVLNPRFRENVQRLSKAWHDRPLPPLDTAIYWTEFAARHANFSFEPAAAPLYQNMYLDVASVFVISILVLMFIFKSVGSLCSKDRSNIKNIANKKIKKK